MSGGSKNTAMPAPEQKDRLYRAAVSELHRPGHAKPSHMLCSGHWFFRTKRTLKDLTEYWLPSCKLGSEGRAEREKAPQEGGAGPSPPTLAVTLGKAQKSFSSFSSWESRGGSGRKGGLPGSWAEGRCRNAGTSGGSTLKVAVGREPRRSAVRWRGPEQATLTYASLV